MRAFHGDPAIKASYLARVRAHRDADEIRHGDYWLNRQGPGCAYERELGLPRMLAYLEEGIFECLPRPQDCAWTEAVLEAIPVGADLATIHWWPPFVVALLSDPEHGVLRYVQGEEYVTQRQAIAKVVEFYTTWIATGERPDGAAVAATYEASAAAGAAAAATASLVAVAATTAATSATAAAAASAAAGFAAGFAASAAGYATETALVTGTPQTPPAVGEEAVAAHAIWQSQVLLALLRNAPMVAAG